MFDAKSQFNYLCDAFGVFDEWMGAMGVCAVGGVVVFVEVLSRYFELMGT